MIIYKVIELIISIDDGSVSEWDTVEVTAG